MEGATSCLYRASSLVPLKSLLSLRSSPQRFSLRASNVTKNPPKLSTTSKKKKRYQAQKSLQQQQQQCVPSPEEASISVHTVHQNGDPLGRKDLGKCVVRWISGGIRSMASDLATAEIEGEFSELRQRLGIGVASGNGSPAATGGLAFVIQAQPYLYAVPMPKGLEALCFKACTHYPTLFDHFQRELRDVLQEYQKQGVFEDWRETESWKLLKEFANSGEIF